MCYLATIWSIIRVICLSFQGDPVSLNPGVLEALRVICGNDYQVPHKDEFVSQWWLKIMTYMSHLGLGQIMSLSNHSKIYYNKITHNYNNNNIIIISVNFTKDERRN